MKSVKLGIQASNFLFSSLTFYRVCSLGLYLQTIRKNIVLFFRNFQCEINTTSDWLNHTIGLANQKLCYFHIWKFLEKKTIKNEESYSDISCRTYCIPQQ